MEKKKLQLIFEQHQFELQGSTYKWIFSIVNAQDYSSHSWLSPRLWGSGPQDTIDMKRKKESRSVMSDSLQTAGL